MLDLLMIVSLLIGFGLVLELIAWCDRQIKKEG